MSSNNVFNALVELVSQKSISSAAGKLIYSCKIALRPGDHYIVGFNPGGDPLVEEQKVIEHLAATPEGPWSEYTQGRWVLNKKLNELGRQNRQVRVQRWATEVGIDLEHSFCANVLFARGATVEKTRKDPQFFEYLNDCSAIHGFLIENIRPKKVFCFGGDAYDTFLRLEKTCDFKKMTNRSSGNGSYDVIKLPHFSLRSSDDDFVEAAVKATTAGAPTVNHQTFSTDGWPVVVLQDRYGGTYSKGMWLAIAVANHLENGAYRVVRCLEDGPFGDDTDAMLFWAEPPEWIAVGDSPNDALHALYAKNRYLGTDMTHEL